MTTLESRVAALEQDVAWLYAAMVQLSTGQTLFSSLAAGQLKALIERVQQLRDELHGGDEWKGFE